MHPQVEGWEVVCEDTVLFPEGGGQNSDRGQLGGRPVLHVRGATAGGDDYWVSE